MPGPFVKHTTSTSCIDLLACSRALATTCEIQRLWCRAVSEGRKPSPGGVT